MSRVSHVDQKPAPPALHSPEAPPAVKRKMTSFVESCVGTVEGSAVAAARGARHRPHAQKLLRVLHGKRRILITTHQHPDPDALASSLALARLLRLKLDDAEITLSVKNFISGGLNAAFAQQTALALAPWDESALWEYDAIVLLDVQPTFQFSPLPQGIFPTAVIDHHRSRGPKLDCPFCDVRTEVGATSSIIFSYFMELETPIDSDLAATLLFAIETDLAGAAGTPGELDNLALSSLTLLADTRKLYKMRYVDLPQAYYSAYSSGLANAVFWEDALVSHLETVHSPETPAVIADFLLRFDQVQFVLVSAVIGSSLVLSLRTSSSKLSAADMMKRLLRRLGEGGGHRTKAGGIVALENGTPTELERVRKTLRRRFLRALNIPITRGQHLVAPKH